MKSLSFKIAISIIVAGMFAIVACMAVNHANLNAGFYFISYLTFIFICLFGIAIGEAVALPLKRLLEKAQDLARGDLKSRLLVSGKSETAQLAVVFNSMADKFEKSILESDMVKKSISLKMAENQSLKESARALEQKVQNRTLEFEKTAQDLTRSRQLVGAREVELVALKNQLAELRRIKEEESAALTMQAGELRAMLETAETKKVKTKKPKSARPAYPKGGAGKKPAKSKKRKK